MSGPYKQLSKGASGVGRALLSPIRVAGRYTTITIAFSVVIGLAIPALPPLIRPYLQPLMFALMFLNMLRVEPSALQGYFERPLLPLAASLWMLLVIPASAAAILGLIGIENFSEGTRTIVLMVTAAPPVMSAVALLFFLGFNGTLGLALTLLTTIAAPFTAPLLAAYILPEAETIQPLALAANLFLLLAGSTILARLVRHKAGAKRIAEHTETINGVSCVAFFCFTVAAMDGLTATTLARPIEVLAMLGVTFAVALSHMAITFAVFKVTGRNTAFTVAFSAGMRNLGLMVAAMGGIIPPLAWLFFSVAQIPINLLPLLFTPLARRWNNTNSAQQDVENALENNP
ncbi:symporter [Rhodobacteraceae bacterium RKSG542]|uniref:symporter n=1 Tax=Pseudovibrio flavus TaxID=2529854 RepID=UPI0012BC1454|nr:symporter [Pseudovibrio flavus]MTI19320.1 symporter [Pseudovibrio flavus]